MNAPLLTVTTIIALAAFYVLLPLVVHTFQRYCGTRVLKCPETGGPAEVDINARGAAFSSAFGKPLVRVKSCTLWPKRKGCGEECVKEK